MRCSIVLAFLLILTSAMAALAQEGGRRSGAAMDIPPAPVESEPVAVKWLMDSLSVNGRETVTSVYLIYCATNSSKGTGFLLSSGYVVTAHHVIAGCPAEALSAISTRAVRLAVTSIAADDSHRDLAALKVQGTPQTGLKIDTRPLDVGLQVSTWGHPLGYDGPTPLLAVGYVSGFRADAGTDHSRSPVKHLVVNAAFNPGNSGGPLLMSGEPAVVGVVVSKHAPMSPYLQSEIDVLAQNPYGMMYVATDPAGNRKQVSEAQIVADVLIYFRSMTQVVIGEAVAADELVAFLNDHKIPWVRFTPPSQTRPSRKPR
ncbi:MAG: serine protease [Bryobacteraceae bacterium]